MHINDLYHYEMLDTHIVGGSLTAEQADGDELQEVQELHRLKAPHFEAALEQESDLCPVGCPPAASLTQSHDSGRHLEASLTMLVRMPSRVPHSDFPHQPHKCE